MTDATLPRRSTRPTAVRARSCAITLLLALGAIAASRPPVSAQPTPHEQPDGWVIPPGQESLLVAMLGGDRPVEGCVAQETSIEQDRVHIRYRCDPGGTTPTIVLRHRGEGQCAGTCTAKFAITARTETPPPSTLVPALARNIERGESGFRWTLASQASSDHSTRSFLGTPGRIAANVLVVVVAGIVFLRMFRRARSAT